MEEGAFVEWLKHDGDRVRPGDPLFMLESDKATENVEALDAGILRIGPEGRLLPHTSARRVIAARMVAGVTQAAPVTLTTRADATNLVNLRGQFRAAAPEEAAPGYTDVIIKLTAAALRRHLLLQAQWRD